MILGRHKSAGLMFVAAAFCLASAALAQDTPKPQASKGDVSDALPDEVELSPFGGVSLFGQINHGLGEKLENGGTGGGRVAFNLSRWVGIELSYNFSGNNVRLLTPIAPGLPTYDFHQQSHQLSLDPVINLRPRGSRVQPYLTAGFGLMKFIPTKQALDFATNPVNEAIYQSGALRRDNEVVFNYGGGVKFHVSSYFGLRFDVRGLVLPKNPTFGLPSSSDGGIYIASKNVMSGLDATLGLVFYLGRHVVPPAPIPIAPPTPINPGDITGAGGTLCAGKPITLHSTASDPLNHPLKYTWKLNGQPQSAEGADFTFTPNNAGPFPVEVSVVDTTDPKRTATAGPMTVTVQDYMPPQVTSVTATPATLACTDNDGVHSAALAGAATGSACGGDLTYKWSVSPEGSVSNDTSTNATFDASTLSFDSGKAGTKSITATFTATDTTGKSASGTATITVTCKPNFKRLPDIVFSKNNARVNNCGKRILIDTAAPAAGSDYDILLVAHRSQDEKQSLTPTRKGRPAGRSLDEQRALNAAAVLTNGSSKVKTCASVDPTQVMIDTEGTDQTSDPEPGVCGTSNLPAAQRERKGSATTDADKERRVEVYLVPKGSHATPPAAKNVKPLPESVVKGIGCPK